ncbi:MAG: hypothetical protein WC421_02965 [Elusimicrobiales bacterium]
MTQKLKDILSAIVMSLVENAAGELLADLRGETQPAAPETPAPAAEPAKPAAPVAARARRKARQKLSPEDARTRKAEYMRNWYAKKKAAAGLSGAPDSLKGPKGEKLTEAQKKALAAIRATRSADEV